MWYTSADMRAMATIAIETISCTWDSFMGRCLLLGLPLSWGAFVLLGMAHAALTK